MCFPYVSQESSVSCLRRTSADVEEGGLILSRMVDLCHFNLARLFVVWDAVLGTITEVSTTDGRSELGTLEASVDGVGDLPGRCFYCLRQQFS